MSTYPIRSERLSLVPTVAMRATLTPAEMEEWFATAFETTYAVAITQGVVPTGPPYARYHDLGDGRFEVEAGFPVSGQITAGSGAEPSELPEGMVAITTHTGPYDDLGPAYAALEDWIAEQDGVIVGDPWEIYLTNPMSQPDPDAWRTDVVMPYRIL